MAVDLAVRAGPAVYMTRNRLYPSTLTEGPDSGPTPSWPAR